MRSDRLRAKDSKVVKRVLGLPNVMLFYESRVSEIRGEGNRLTELVLERLAHDSEAQVGRVKNSNTHKEGQKKENGREILPIDALFLAIGSRPNTALLSELLLLLVC